MLRFALAVCIPILFLATSSADDFIPRRQDKPPGPPLSPQDAMQKMKVPDGFTVELVASEPQVVNPVAMTIDEKGRFWITESFEYPRKEPGPGRDRIKVLEDTDGDGAVDKVTIFAEGLNIPSGIAVGYGGVWVANSPDILFMQDTDGDLKADKIEKIVTGFGRTDTHELPNSFTWGPDGWLYGLNGVFNFSNVRYAKDNPNYDENQPSWKFTCALYRIHPRTRKFEIFAEGTSNPWGIAWNNNGEAFLSACVIDHLWHLTESGYYHRQGGPYPPHTWKIESIVNHTHQLAAYCGIHYYDADAYPEKYRRKLYMGNIHGNCINSDALRRDGSTYFGTAEPDFLSGNDVWFMPVAQKTGPDGNMYILDWYDRYHCYQDANRDPKGIDRGHGRLYRIRYGKTPRTPAGFDLGAESDDELIARLQQHNDYVRWTAHRLLSERSNAETRKKVQALALDRENALRQSRLFAMWTAMSMRHDQSQSIDSDFITALSNDPDPTFRAWAVRLSGHDFLNSWKPASVTKGQEMRLFELVNQAIGDESPDVRLQGVILAGRHARIVKPRVEYGELLAQAVVTTPDDKLLPKIAWRNLVYNLERRPEQAVEFAEVSRIADCAGGQDMLPRLIQWLLDRPQADAAQVAKIIGFHAFESGGNPQVAGTCLSILADGVQNRTIAGAKLAAIKKALTPLVQKILKQDGNLPPHYWTAMLSASWGDPLGLQAVRTMLTSPASAEHDRLAALNALVAAKEENLLIKTVDDILGNRKNTAPFRGKILGALGRLNDNRVADVVLAHYGQLEPELKPQAIDLLTQRTGWSRELLAAIGKKNIPANALNLNQVRRLLSSKDKKLKELVTKNWGVVRETRNPQRDKVIAEMKQLIRSGDGDPFNGQKVFKKLCGQCHKIYGEGFDVGPDITLNGRNSFEQLLSNVFDPSLVIGSAYQSYSLVTTEGRVLNGLLVEDTPEKITLKIQGGKIETIPRNEIEALKKSELSLMPEDLEKQLKPKEIQDLFAFITLDKPPSDPNARRLPGVKEVVERIATNPEQYAEVIGEVAPGFTTKKSGVGDVFLQKSHMGRSTVVRTHPVSRTEPCVLTGRFDIPTGKKTWLLVDVSHHPQGTWRFVAKVNGKQVFSDEIGTDSTKGWQSFRIDLTKYAGQNVKIDLENRATGWTNEFAYWGRAVVASE